MKRLEPTYLEQFRYDPETGEVVLVKEGFLQPVDPRTLSPKVRKVLAEMREEGNHLERQLKAQARRKRKSA